MLYLFSEMCPEVGQDKECGKRKSSEYCCFFGIVCEKMNRFTDPSM